MHSRHMTFIASFRDALPLSSRRYISRPLSGMPDKTVFCRGVRSITDPFVRFFQNAGVVLMLPPACVPSARSIAVTYISDTAMALIHLCAGTSDVRNAGTSGFSELSLSWFRRIYYDNSGCKSYFENLPFNIVSDSEKSSKIIFQVSGQYGSNGSGFDRSSSCCGSLDATSTASAIIPRLLIGSASHLRSMASAISRSNAILRLSTARRSWIGNAVMRVSLWRWKEYRHSRREYFRWAQEKAPVLRNRGRVISILRCRTTNKKTIAY